MGFVSKSPLHKDLFRSVFQPANLVPHQERHIHILCTLLPLPLADPQTKRLSIVGVPEVDPQVPYVPIAVPPEEEVLKTLWESHQRLGERLEHLDYFASVALDFANNPGKNWYILHPTSVDPASPVSHFSSQCARVPGSLINTGPSPRASSRPKLISVRFRPHSFCLETIVGTVEQKAAWFWFRIVEAVTVSTQCNTDKKWNANERKKDLTDETTQCNLFS